MSEPEALKLTPKQHEMIYVHEDVDELFYGGQAGGAKSEGLLRFALRRRIECPGSVGLALRKTFPELERSLIRKSRKFYHPYAKWKEAKKRWDFNPQFDGSIQEFGYVDKETDLDQYQSAEYDDILFDELGHFKENVYTYLMSRLRPRAPKPGLKYPDGTLVKPWKGLMRSAGNPGGIGHNWIRARFADACRNKVIKVFDEEEGTFKSRLFIPATLGDNTLMTPKERREYRAWLNMLPEAERRQLRDGDWDFNPGAAFSELTRKTHAYDPKEIPVPKWAPIIMSYDFGFGKPFSIGWWWVDYDGRLWRFAEWYGWNGKPDTGVRMAPSMIGRGIIEREKKMDIHDRVISRPSDPSIFAKKANYKGGGLGPSPADMMADVGIFLSPSDNSRILGKQQFHERLRVPDDGERPLAMISNECTQFWRTIPSLPLETEGVNAYEDVVTDSEDHIYDEARYCFMSRPIMPEFRKPDDTDVEKIIKRIITPEELFEEAFGTFDL